MVSLRQKNLSYCLFFHWRILKKFFRQVEMYWHINITADGDDVLSHTHHIRWCSVVDGNTTSSFPLLPLNQPYKYHNHRHINKSKQPHTRNIMSSPPPPLCSVQNSNWKGARQSQRCETRRQFYVRSTNWHGRFYLCCRISRYQSCHARPWYYEEQQKAISERHLSQHAFEGYCGAQS